MCRYVASKGISVKTLSHTFLAEIPIISSTKPRRCWQVYIRTCLLLLWLSHYSFQSSVLESSVGNIFKTFFPKCILLASDLANEKCTHTHKFETLHTVTYNLHSDVHIPKICCKDIDKSWRYELKSYLDLLLLNPLALICENDIRTVTALYHHVLRSTYKTARRPFRQGGQFKPIM